jgi:hypothetical protein
MLMKGAEIYDNVPGQTMETCFTESVNDSVRRSCGAEPSNNLQTSASQAGLWEEK